PAAAPGLEGGLALVVIRDMTESRAGRQQSALLSSIVKSTDESIIGTDVNGLIVTWNQGAEHLFGYTEEEALGRHLMILYPQDRQKECLDNLNKIGLREHRPRYESRRVRKDGSEFDVSVVISPIQNDGGKLMGMSAMCRDITERKRADAALLVAKEAAELASRAKSEFLANMSHGLRTPLNGVLGLTDVMLDSDLTDEERQEYLTVVKHSARSLLATLNDILDIARIQSGKYLLQPKQFWLRDLVATTMKEFDEAAREKNLQFTWRIHPDVPQVLLGDPDCLRQILSNLVENAVKFTAAGDVVVTVEASHRDPSLLSFSVRDTGGGVPVDRQRVIFDPFSQVDNSLRRQFGGTGLGLAICAQLIDIMGGRIWVDSDGHTGSTFHFTVRLEPVPATPGETAAEPGVQPTLFDRRREARRPAHDPALLKVLRPFSSLALEIQILDASKAGLRVRVNQSLDPGVLVQINLKDTVAVAEVRYCLPAGAHFHLGLEFVSP
ncbi:MAG: ATP-binding protein, partial [Bryobacteraceae bacterium]